MRIKEILQTTKLPAIESEIILAYILKKDRSFLSAFPETQLTRAQLARFLDYRARRENHEPLAYILGYKEFFALKFLVNEDVLIPRGETEELVEAVLKKIKILTNPIIADIGTGSGCIAVSIAVNHRQAKIYATDVSEKALTVAKKNARLHQVSKQITFRVGNLTDPIKTKVDLILANLPYIPTKRMNQLESEVKNFEPRLALDGGNDGMKFYNQLFQQAKKILTPNGTILYEVDGEIFEKSAENALN